MAAYLTTLGLIALFLLVSALIGIRDRRRQDAGERRALAEAFGKPGAKEYPDGRFHELPRYLERHRREYVVDDITWNDLDMDLLFRSMDTTSSSAGEEYLYWLLRTPVTGDLPRCSEEGMHWWKEHDQERIDVQRILQRLGRSGKYSPYEYLDLMNELPDRKAMQDLAAVIMPVIALIVMAFNPPAGVICLLFVLALNIVSYFRVKRQIDPYLFTFRYVLRLLDCVSLLAAVPFPHYETEKESMQSAARSFKRFARGSGILLRGNGGNASGNPIDLILDYMCILFHIDLIKFGLMLKELRGKEEEVDRMITAIGSIDAQISIASWRESLPVYCEPVLTGTSFEAEGLIHPLLNDPVPNDMKTERPVLLTGSNASGKSTFLKAAALAALLSQSVHTAPARLYKNTCCRIYTSMALRDDIRTGESYFIVEIRSLKRILEAASDDSGIPVLCCVDEVLRGTNTIERISASAQILLQLSSLPIQVFAATHDIELTGLLKEIYENYHFSETITGDDVTFSYQLQEGPADTRNAIRLLRTLGYDDAIADQAEERAVRFTKTGHWEL